jgi:hypothetical protein
LKFHETTKEKLGESKKMLGESKEMFGGSKKIFAKTNEILGGRFAALGRDRLRRA